MGVDGLHKLVRSTGIKRTPADLRGLTLGVDGYGWLHKAAVSCAEDLVAGRPTSRLVEWVDRRVRLYEQAGVSMFFVFDGAPLPAKARIESQRAAARELAKADIAACRTGSAARALDVTPAHAAQVTAYLRSRGIRFVVAPYEADAQLVYLEKRGFVDAILSEDGDLLVFGAQRLLTKADPNGACIEIAASQFAKSELRAMAAPGERDWQRLLRALAIVSGCDYSPGVRGIGPMKAMALIRRYGCASAVIDSLTVTQRLSPDFQGIVSIAEMAFCYQRVWDPETRSITTLNEPQAETILRDEAIGPRLAPDLAARIARAIVCPLSHQPLMVPPVVAAFARRQRPFCPTSSSRASLATKRIASFATPQRVSERSPFFARTNSSPLPSRPITSSLSSNADNSPLAMRKDTIPDTPSVHGIAKTPVATTPAVKSWYSPTPSTPVSLTKSSEDTKENLTPSIKRSGPQQNSGAKRPALAQLDLNQFVYSSN